MCHDAGVWPGRFAVEPLLTRPRLWFRLPLPESVIPSRSSVWRLTMAHKLFIGDLAAAADRGKMSGPMTSLNALREQGQMTWSEDEQSWTGAPEEIFAALAADGFAECKREMTRSRRNCRPVGGLREGRNSL